MRLVKYDKVQLPEGWKVIRIPSDRCSDGCCDFFDLQGPGITLGYYGHTEEDAAFRGMVLGHFTMYVLVSFEGEYIGYFRPKDGQHTERVNRKDVLVPHKEIAFCLEGREEKFLRPWQAMNQDLHRYACDVVDKFRQEKEEYGIYQGSTVEYQLSLEAPVSRFNREPLL